MCLGLVSYLVCVCSDVLELTHRGVMPIFVNLLSSLASFCLSSSIFYLLSLIYYFYVLPLTSYFLFLYAFYFFFLSSLVLFIVHFSFSFFWPLLPLTHFVVCYCCYLSCFLLLSECCVTCSLQELWLGGGLRVLQTRCPAS